MMGKSLFKSFSRYSFYATEWAMIVYLLLTSLLEVALSRCTQAPWICIGERVGVVLIICLLCLWGENSRWKLLNFVRHVFPAIFCIYLYRDTFHFNRCFENLDHLFASCEQMFWRCQPALLFSEVFHWRWLSEIFDFGYFFYYILITLFIALMVFKYKNECCKALFLMITSFLFYYAIFIFIPVVGPQFYFPVIGMDAVKEGNFPAIFSYFRFAPPPPLETPVIGPCSFIRYALLDPGEVPTGAFPSSHVGITTVIMLYFWKYHKRIFYVCLFPCFLLVCSTVYIQAHYLIDIVAGFLTAYIFYYLSLQIYENLPCRKNY